MQPQDTSICQSVKAAQIERDFGIPHPERRLDSALGWASDAEVSPFTLKVGRDHVVALTDKGAESSLDCAVVLLMSGARREAVAGALGYDVSGLGSLNCTLRGRVALARSKAAVARFVHDVREHVEGLADVEWHIERALAGIDLWRRA